ncbi:MAG: hypothetical protein R6U31_01015 [bacterium]
MRKFILFIVIIFCILLQANEKALVSALGTLGKDPSIMERPAGYLRSDAPSSVRGILEAPYSYEDYSVRLLDMIERNAWLRLIKYIDTGEFTEMNRFKTLLKVFSRSGSPVLASFIDSCWQQSRSFRGAAKSRYDSVALYKYAYIIEQIMESDNDELTALFSSYPLSRGVIYDDTLTVIRGSMGDDTYILSGPNTIIFDPGGNDRYIGTGPYSIAGGVNGFACIIDLEGHDQYIGPDSSLCFSSNGAALIDDRSGNDIYTGGDFSLCFSHNGLSVLSDESGDDIYMSGSYSQSSAAGKGISILADIEGNDRYMSDARYTQGASDGEPAGGIGGTAVLADLDGNDRYTAGGYSQGFGAHFSMGLLYDTRGNDIYISGEFSQGCGAHNGAGVLADNAGNDRYEALSYSQGFARHSSAGILSDYSGNDIYSGTVYSQGSAMLMSSGMLFDMSGEDAFNNDSLSCGTVYDNSPDFSIGVLYKTAGSASINGRDMENRFSEFWGIRYYAND